MRLLIDANLSPVVAALLRDAGFDAVHVVDHGLGTALDSEIAQFAVEQTMAIVSADSDFATMLALNQGSAPSLVLLRSADQLPPSAQAAMLIANLPSVTDDLQAGAVVSLRPGRLRARRLPLP